MPQQKERLGACGLDCIECDLYKLPTDKTVQDKILPWFREKGWLKEGEGIEVVIEKKMYCKGCGDPDVCWSADCRMAKCCKEEKKLHNCAQCDSFICEDIRAHKETNDRYREGVEYLEKSRNQSST